MAREKKNRSWVVVRLMTGAVDQSGKVDTLAQIVHRSRSEKKAMRAYRDEIGGLKKSDRFEVPGWLAGEVIICKLMPEDAAQLAG